MRTSSSCHGAIIVIALAFGGADVRAAEPVADYPTAIDAYRQGLDAYRSGQSAPALRALEYAAERGILGAQLKLAKMYAAGDGAPRSDGKAFRHYQRIADQHAEISPSHPVARFVSEAFMALSDYYRAGLPEIGLAADPYRAVGPLLHAASYFGDATAQYRLAGLYLRGEGVYKDAGLAVNWLVNASKKRHAPSQALLGELLWQGADGVERQPLRGLALLALARHNAGQEDLARIEQMHARAFAEAKAADRERAEKVAAHWIRRPQDGDAALAEGTIAPAPQPAEPAPAAAQAPAAAPAAITPVAKPRPSAAVMDVAPGKAVSLPQPAVEIKNAGAGDAKASSAPQ